MAAESHVDNSILNPDNFITTNIIGTYNILQASLEFFKSKNSENNFCFHHVSTDEVYGSLEKNEKAFIEDSKYKPNSPYSASKAGSDHLVRAWQKTYGLPCIITSCTNNFGPFQHPEKLMPVVIINGILKNKIPIYGTGKNIRDWIYVEDHVEALISIMEKNLRNKTYLIGSNNEKENIETVDTICKVLDKVSDTSYFHQNLKFFVKDRLGHDFRYSINSNLIKKEIRWKAKIDFKNGILKTVNWYLKNETWWNKLINKV
jgi:dTDP-glucose 4,6-dehydratase